METEGRGGMQGLLEEYGAISDEIEEEKQREMDRLISDFASILLKEQGINDDSEGGSNPDGEKWHKKAMLALLCLRIKINGSLIRAGSREYFGQFGQDIEDVLDHVKEFLWAWEVTDIILDEA